MGSLRLFGVFGAMAFSGFQVGVVSFLFGCLGGILLCVAVFIILLGVQLVAFAIFLIDIFL